MEIPAALKDRIEGQKETCLCNEDYTSCICCETVLTPPFVACDLVINGKEVTGPASSVMDFTTDGKGNIEINKLDFDLKNRY